jgi:predicted RNase H-like HicB family nuclease
MASPAEAIEAAGQDGELVTAGVTAVYEFHDGWWVGQTLELRGPVVQERTLDEAKRSMREVIALLLTAGPGMWQAPEGAVMERISLPQ